MKKITRLCKIFLVLVTIFSQLSSVVTVLAEEVLSKPLNIVLEQVTNEDYGYVEYYDFSYITNKFYANLVSNGDSYYVEHVLSYMGDNPTLVMNVSDDKVIELNINNVKSSVRS